MLYQSVPGNKWVLPQPPVRCVADTARTEANHRPDAGQQESATRFRRAVCTVEKRGVRAAPVLAVVCLLGGCTALAACGYGVLVLVAASTASADMRQRIVASLPLVRVGITQRQALCRLLRLMHVVLSLNAVTCRCSISTSPSLPIARCDLRNDPSGDLR